jgi:hypothetical protein
MYTTEQALRGLALLTPPWYSLAMTDEHGTARYGTMAYDSRAQAQIIALLLQEAYERMGYEVVFGVRLRDVEDA